jgi:hypothetical protein
MFAKAGMSRAGALMVAGVLGWCTGAHAQASDPAAWQARAAAAQQEADAARLRAGALARAGGWAYKTGRVEQAQRDAARYQAEADEALATALSCPAPSAPSPAQATALARLAELRSAGGWAYKSGAVARAERDVQALMVGGEAEPVVLTQAQTTALARLDGLRAAGGWAYKTGAVARAERDLQALMTPPSTIVCEGRLAQPRISMK